MYGALFSMQILQTDLILLPSSYKQLQSWNTAGNDWLFSSFTTSKKKTPCFSCLCEHQFLSLSPTNYFWRASWSVHQRKRLAIFFYTKLIWINFLISVFENHSFICIMQAACTIKMELAELCEFSNVMKD